MTSAGQNNLSNEQGTSLIDSIDVNQFVIPKVWHMCFIVLDLF